MLLAFLRLLSTSTTRKKPKQKHTLAFHLGFLFTRQGSSRESRLPLSMRWSRDDSASTSALLPCMFPSTTRILRGPSYLRRNAFDQSQESRDEREQKKSTTGDDEPASEACPRATGGYLGAVGSSSARAHRRQSRNPRRLKTRPWARGSRENKKHLWCNQHRAAAEFYNSPTAVDETFSVWKTRKTSPREVDVPRCRSISWFGGLPAMRVHLVSRVVHSGHLLLLDHALIVRPRRTRAEHL